MFRTLAAVVGAAFLVVASQGPASAEGPSRVPETIEWAIAPSGSDGGSQVQLTLSYRSSGGHSQWSNSTDLSELQGLSIAQLASREGGPARFQIRRDAGLLDCEGLVRLERGTGECRFAADPAFASALEQRGIGRPSDAQMFGLALSRVGLDLVGALERHRYDRPTLGDLVRGGIHGVSADFVRSMTEAGYHVGALDGLIEMRIHGVSPAYVRALAEAGYRPEASMLRQLAIHGVTTDFIRDMGELGYRRLSAEDLVGLKIHGVSARFVRDMADLGYRGLTADQLRNMRIHGVTADFVRAKLRPDFRPSPEELVSLRIHSA